MSTKAPYRNRQLSSMMDWADQNDIDLDQAELTPQWGRISFYHRNETAENMRNVKRVVGKFKHSGLAPYVTLEAEVQHGSMKLWITYLGAFECSVTHHCAPAKFEDGSTLELE